MIGRSVKPVKSRGGGGAGVERREGHYAFFFFFLFGRLVKRAAGPPAVKRTAKRVTNAPSGADPGEGGLRSGKRPSTPAAATATKEPRRGTVLPGHRR